MDSSIYSMDGRKASQIQGMSVLVLHKGFANPSLWCERLFSIHQSQHLLQPLKDFLGAKESEVLSFVRLLLLGRWPLEE